MANSDKVSGFKLVAGSARPNKFLKCAVSAAYGTALAVGDAVVRSGTLNAETGSQAKNLRNGLVEVQVLTAGATNGLGVIVSVEANPDDLSKTHIPASTGGLVTVCTDPFAHYVVQEDSVGSTLAAVDAGLLIDLIDAGVSASGVSGMEIDSSTVTTSGQFRLHQLYSPNLENAIGANAKWIVSWAEHEDITDAVSV